MLLSERVPAPPAALVSAPWLSAQLGRPGLVVLDASWYLPGEGRDAFAEYQSAHVPGAGFFDLDRASDPSGDLPHMLPSEQDFGRYARALGVSADSTVVVYDGSGRNLSAARAWWMFRVFGLQTVALLDGGLVRWRALGLPLESGTVHPAHGSFTARLDRRRICDRATVAAALRSGSALVVDARARERFVGSAPEPRPGLSSGHMPGALNLPYGDLVHPDGTALAPEDLRARFEAGGIGLDRPVIATCGSGVSACNVVLALHRLGHDDTAVYDGSWTEWAGSGMPIAMGEP